MTQSGGRRGRLDIDGRKQRHQLRPTCGARARRRSRRRPGRRCVLSNVSAATPGREALGRLDGAGRAVPADRRARRPASNGVARAGPTPQRLEQGGLDRLAIGGRREADRPARLVPGQPAGRPRAAVASSQVTRSGSLSVSAASSSQSCWPSPDQARRDALPAARTRGPHRRPRGRSASRSARSERDRARRRSHRAARG